MCVGCDYLITYRRNGFDLREDSLGEYSLDPLEHKPYTVNRAYESQVLCVCDIGLSCCYWDVII